MAVRTSANFLANLDRIEAFWEANGFAKGYDFLLDELSDRVLPQLERHPAMGRRLLSRAVQGSQALPLHADLALRLAALAQGAEIREYVMDDYLLLYLLQGTSVVLLSIRHHKELGFDLSDFLSEGE